MVDPLYKPTTMGDLLKWEVNPNHSREAITIAQGAAYLLGTILGRKRVGGTVTVGAAVADSGNVGNGTLTLAGTPYGAAVKEGNYRVLFTAATKANVEDPNGVNIGVATVGTAFSKDVAFTLAAGGTAFAAGDAFTIPVSVAGGGGKWAPWNPAGTDGTEQISGVLLFNIDATDADVDTVAVCRDALVSKDALVFVNAATDAQKADAYAALAQLGITVRETV